MGLGVYVGNESPEYDVTTFFTRPPRKNRAPSDDRLSMTRGNCGSEPQVWRTSSRAAAVHRECPTVRRIVSPGRTLALTASTRVVCLLTSIQTARARPRCESDPRPDRATGDATPRHRGSTRW